jgi:hypothetical protein
MFWKNKNKDILRMDYSEGEFWHVLMNINSLFNEIINYLNIYFKYNIFL